jgi:hypothetical protein
MTANISGAFGGFVSAALVLAALLAWLAYTGRLPSTKDRTMTRQQLADRVDELEQGHSQDRALIAELQAGRQRDQARINELQAVVNALASKLAEAQHTIERLQDQVRRMDAERPAGKRPEPVRRPPLRPLLVVCGDDPRVAGQDLAVLDGIGVRYTRLWRATAEQVGDEVRRATEDGRPYRWAVVSAHAGADGVQLAELVPPLWWQRNFGGFEVVLLAACTTTNVADALRDRAGFVAYCREDVNSSAANQFVQRFMQRLNAGDEPETAFTSACDSVPEVASQVDFRRKPQ